MSSIVYLSKKNQPRRITTKLFSAYKRAKGAFLSANENYNRAVLGITSLEFAWIREAEWAVSGVCPELASLKSINEWLADPTYLTDGEGRYLTYLGKTISVQAA